MRPAWTILGIALILAAGGCGRRTGDGAAHGNAHAVAVDTTGDETPAVLRRPAIGPRDSLMRTLRGPLREWVALWKAASPEFELDSLRFAGWADFHPEPDAQPWTVPDSLDADEQGLNALVVGSPGSRYRLLIDRYQMITGGGEIGGEPDSAPVLADLGTGRTFTVESCGTACGFHWAAWVDSARFVLGGWETFGDAGDRVCGTLGYYDLRRGVAAQYLVPIVPPGAYERYVSAWRDQVLARLRRLKVRPRA